MGDLLKNKPIESAIISNVITCLLIIWGLKSGFYLILPIVFVDLYINSTILKESKSLPKKSLIVISLSFYSMILLCILFVKGL